MVGSRLLKSIKVKFEADTRGLDKGLDHVEVRTGKVSRTSEKLERLGKASEGLAVLGVSLEGMREGFTGSIEAATDLGEQMNKANVVFGSSSKMVEDWSKKSATSFGVSRTAALEYAGIMGNMLVPMGIARDKAASMSTKFIQLAGDIASFENVNPEDALQAMRSALSGEIEPMRRFGVFLNQTRIQSQAVSMGLVKVKVDTEKLKAEQIRANLAQEKYSEAVRKYGAHSKEAAAAQATLITANATLKKTLAGSHVQLTAQQKAMATYAIIMHDTHDAQGDFVRTSSSLANKSRILKAEFGNLQVQLGQLLLPAIQFGANLFSIFTGILENHGKVVKLVGAAIGVAAIALTAFVYSMKIGRGVTNAIADAQKAFGKIMGFFTVETEAATVATEEQTVATRGLNLALLSNPITIVVAALVALGVAFYEAWQHSETFRRIVKGAWEDVKTAALTVGSWFTQKVPRYFQVVKDWVATHWPEIATLISGPFAPLVALATNAFGIRDKIEGAFRGIKTFVGDRVDDVVGFFKALPDRLAKTIAALGRDFIEPFKSAFGAAKGWISDNIIGHSGKGASGIVGFFYELPGKIANALGDAAGKLKDAVTGLFKDKLLGWVKSALGISSPSREFVQIGHYVVLGLIHGLEHMAPALLAKVKGLVGGLPRTALHEIGRAAGFLKGVGSSVVGSVGGFFGGLFGGGGGTSGGLSGARALGQMMAARHGWGSFAEWSALDALWNRESGWNPLARNPSSGAFGIPQALPATKMPLAAQRGDAASQIAWGLNYIAGRYGDPLSAWAHELRFGWYDRGGVLKPGMTLAYNATGHDETILPVPPSALGGALHIHFHGGTFIGSNPEQVARDLEPALRKQMYGTRRRNVTLGLS